jgi:hypothetical protein
MWPFKRRKSPEAPKYAGPECVSCGSQNTKLKVNFGNDRADYIKTWRGNRYLTYHCNDCHTEFSIPEPDGGIDVDKQIGSELIDDEEALKAAEEELKRETDQDGDHRFG